MTDTEKVQKPHKMNWPLVILALRDEAARDMGRAQDAIRQQNKEAASQFAHAAIVANRLASAFEIGMRGEDAIGKDQSAMAKRTVEAEPPKVTRGRPPGIKEKKPRGPRKKKDDA